MTRDDPRVPVREAMQVIVARLEAYRLPGGPIDLETAMLDIIGLLKIGGRPKDEFLIEVAKLWDDIEISEGSMQ